MKERALEHQRVIAPPGDLMHLVAWVCHLIPKNFLSWLVGVLARLELPGPLGGWLVKLFVRSFKIDLSDAEKPLSEYRSIEEVFVRRLKPGSRTIGAAPISPADGFLARSAPALGGMAVQVKGTEYDLGDLILGERADPVPSLDLAWYVTVYLAPPNYHRVHSPVAGRLKTIRYVPGELWPVNKPFLRAIPRLFNRNERVIFDIELADGGMVYVVMVGAFNVGRIETPHWPGFSANAGSRQLGTRPRRLTFDAPIELAPGDELGSFLLGSTVVVVFDRKAAAGLALLEAADDRPLRMGQTLVRT